MDSNAGEVLTRTLDCETMVLKGGPNVCLAIPGKVVQVEPDNLNRALVEVLGVRRKVDLSLLAEESPQPDDWVLIHVGFAMSKISEEDAQEQIRLLRILGEGEAAMEEIRGYGSSGAESEDET